MKSKEIPCKSCSQQNCIGCQFEYIKVQTDYPLNGIVLQSIFDEKEKNSFAEEVLRREGLAVIE